MLDVFHMDAEEHSVSHGFTLAKDKLIYIHIADSHRQAPGKGKYNSKKFCRP
ncbi:hypothetical protein [Ammoniphilus sp. YIM 78166]|uniref:hypothetical protein n=1 Tax=Ammoniphilus sp. YIM 78166 TaxID=1644106 RepID=UPI001430C192|nr:hypothetical protein [Ammoniphilus sp. YIM 78166]